MEENLQHISRTIPVDLIDAPNAPIRSTLDEDEFLALVDSLRTVGQITPIVCIANGDRFEVVAGHRRYLAIKHLKWPHIECRIVPKDEDMNTAVLIHENSFREAVSPEDEGVYFDKLSKSRNMSIKDIAKMVNRSHYYVQERLTITTYPPDLRNALREKQISMAVCKELARIQDNAERRRLLAYAVDQGCSGRTAKQWADTWEVTQTTIDESAPVALPPSDQTQYSVPMFPCFLCESPTSMLELTVARLCGGCLNVCNETRRASRAAGQDSQGGTHTRGGASITEEGPQSYG